MVWSHITKWMGLVEAYWLLILVGYAPSDKRKIIRSCMVLAWGGMTEGMIHSHAFLGAMSLWGW